MTDKIDKLIWEVNNDRLMREAYGRGPAPHQIWPNNNGIAPGDNIHSVTSIDLYIPNFKWSGFQYHDIDSHQSLIRPLKFWWDKFEIDTKIKEFEMPPNQSEQLQVLELKQKSAITPEQIDHAWHDEFYDHILITQTPMIPKGTKVTQASNGLGFIEGNGWDPGWNSRYENWYVSDNEWYWTDEADKFFGEELYEGGLIGSRRSPTKRPLVHEPDDYDYIIIDQEYVAWTIERSKGNIKDI